MQSRESEIQNPWALSYSFILRDCLSDLLKPQNIEQEILNVEVKPSKFRGSLFYGSIFKISRANFKYLWLVLIILFTSVTVLCFPHVAGAGWADSAHSNTSYGVHRSGATYSIGDCAHCHETVDPATTTCSVDNVLLFYDSWVGLCDLFCFKCHSDATDVQQVDNNPYCVNFGGLTPAYNTNIKQQFCDPGSTYYYPHGARHDLSYIRDFIDNNAQGWGFGSDPNPCVACHNPHYGQRNHPVEVTGALNTAIRRPSHYQSSDAADRLWGDDEGERMDA